LECWYSLLESHNNNISLLIQGRFLKTVKYVCVLSSVLPDPKPAERKKKSWNPRRSVHKNIDIDARLFHMDLFAIIIYSKFYSRLAGSARKPSTS
jgi:hypothetical protein